MSEAEVVGLVRRARAARGCLDGRTAALVRRAAAAFGLGAQDGALVADGTEWTARCMHEIS